MIWYLQSRRYIPGQTVVVAKNETSSGGMEGIHIETERRFKEVAQHYSRVILHSSNFENTKEDENLFEVNTEDVV